MSTSRTGSSLESILDRVEIEELVARYNRASDDGDAETWARCFTADGVFLLGTIVLAEGAAALLALAQSRPYGTVHLTTDRIVEVYGDTATHTCGLLLSHRRQDGQDFTVLTTGRYDDRLVRTDAGWRFTSRSARLDLAPTRIAEIRSAWTPAE